MIEQECLFLIDSGSKTDLKQLLEILKMPLRREIKLKHGENCRGDVVQAVADTGKARNILGHGSSTSLEEGLKKDIRWTEEELSELR